MSGGPVRYHLGGFPPKELDWERLVPLIGQANRALARYDGLLLAIPDASVLLSPLTTQEAVLSSRIEGTNVTMSEVLEIEAGADERFSPSQRGDAEEVLNYRVALRFAADVLRERSFSLHLLRETHALLLRGVRGRDKHPGSFRRQQNWIGPKGCTIEEAHFIPIPQEHLDAGLEAWIRYVQSREELDLLVQLAIAHAEFEALHPFEDGNGRLGRMIIPLFLYGRGILSGPNFYMSGYLEARRDEYVEALRAISRDGAWTEWCEFFLRGLIEQAWENQSKAAAILDLRDNMLREIAELTHSAHTGRIVGFIFSRPVFASAQFIRETGIRGPTALRFLRMLRDAHVLQTVREKEGRRPAIYAFGALLDIVEGTSPH